MITIVDAIPTICRRSYVLIKTKNKKDQTIPAVHNLNALGNLVMKTHLEVLKL